jgi:hypothetical protein
MAQFEKHFVQDLTQDIKIRQCGTIVFNGDNLSNVITVHLYNGTEPYSGGGSVSCSVICPDGATVPITNGSISGNTVTVTLTGDCFALPGQIGVGVQVVSGDIRTTVLKAIYNVELLETDTIVDPGSRITASVGQLVSDIENAVAQIPASDMASLMAGIAPTFSASTNYIAGAYVYYNGTLYRFTTAHSAGSWTGTDATQVALSNDLGSQVSDLKSALTNLFGDVNAQNITVKDGYYFGYDHGDRTSSGFEKLTFNTTFGYIYYIEATTTENLPLFKCGTLYFPALARSESENAERIGCYFIGNGATVSVNAITAQGYIIRECVTPVADTTLYNLPNISASLKQIQNMIYREFEVSTLANAAVDGAGNIISIANNTLYYCCVTGLKKINVSKGSVYAFFYSLPAVGAKSYNGARTVQTLDNTDINVPDGVTYFAVKHTAKPTITVPDSNIISSFAQKTITTTDFDCDTFERNIAYTVGANGITIATNHVPVNGFSGNIFTIGMPQNLAFETQIAFNRNQTVYIRNYYTSWSEWAELAVKSTVDSEIESVNKFYNLLVGQPYTDTVMCIGDSLTRGQTYKSASESYLNKYNYPYFLKAKYFSDATTVSNIARPGYSAKEIWDNLYSNIAAIPDNSLIFCLIGTNEGLTDTVSTDCAGEDISNYNGNTNTGCYGKIVKTLLTKSCKVVLVTPWKSSGTMPTTLKAINDLGAKWNLPVCALSEAMFPDALRTMDGYTDVVHLNAIGYSKLADEIYFGTCKALTNSYCPDFLPEESQ